MNLANALLKIFTLNLNLHVEREKLNQSINISISSLLLAAFFALATLLSFLQSNLPLTLVSLAAFILLTLNLILLNYWKEQPILTHLPVILTGLVLMFYIGTGGITLLGSVIIGLFPLIAISVHGFNRGALISLIFGALSAIILFLPLNLNQDVQLGLGLKISYIFTYIIAIVLCFLIEARKQQLLHSLEKQILDHTSAYKLKEEFIANLSHQIRTPLNNIMVIASILESSTTDDKQKDLIDTIHASTNNLVNVVNSMAEISNVDIKESEILNVSINLNSTISNTIKIFSSQSSSQTTFNLKVEDSIPKNLTGNPVKIKQILLNLIENILKNKSSNRTTIDINVGKSKENEDMVELYFEVKCNKPILLPVNGGQNQYITNEISFSSFSTQMYIDLLDMSITQKLVEENGGKISISLSPENASFAFPYVLHKTQTTVDTPKDEAHRTETEIRTARKAKSPLKLENASVLLVEDNLINQKIVVLSLKKLVKGIEIANNGKEALDKFGTSWFDIILMDIQMPIMNGIVATKKIREIESSTNSHTPIIAITANALLGDKEECLAAGMDDYISKPFQIEVLIQKMKSLLGA